MKSVDLKRMFRYFFTGFDGLQEPQVALGIDKLQITNIDVHIPDDVNDDIIFKVTLGRPGMLIGKGGSTFDAVEKWLSDYAERPVKIDIIESNLWY